MKTLVTHMSPDLDALMSSWLILRFLPKWGEAELAFVPAGKTLNNMPPDADPAIIHVDTGMGKFDHHQTSEYTCASKKVFEYLMEENLIPAKLQPSLERMTNFATEIDHFREIYYPEPASDKYVFLLSETIEGMKSVFQDYHDHAKAVFPLLDGTLQQFRNKVRAEEELNDGFIIQTTWGKGIVLECKNEEAMKVAMKNGYVIVARKDPDRGIVRFKTIPDPKYDLTDIYERVKKMDPNATWFLHASKHMLLNGSTKNPNSIPSKLTPQQLIEIIKKV